MRLSALRQQIFGVHVLSTFDSRLIILIKKLRFLNWSVDLSSMSRILSKALSMIGGNDKNRMQRSS